MRTCTISIGPVPQHADATVLCIHNVSHASYAGKLPYFCPDAFTRQHLLDVMRPKKILVVDDEQDILELISYNLRKEGYEVTTLSESEKAKDVAEKIQPDVVILDVMMPGMDGYDVCKQIRSSSAAECSIMFLTAKNAEIDEILGLELGADDYIQKPVSPSILAARVKSLIRRGSERVRTETISAPEILRVDELEINRQNYTMRIEGKEQFLPKKEFELLAFLVANRGKVFSRESLLSRIWGESVYVVDRTVDVHISKLRDKLGPYSEFLETVKGVGYRFR